ncbi:Bro-N domain-containing protein [Patescibacteria group bacterium]|nr:Bro-N domain-containing protein [Patescibacteria group bacterium]
MDKNNKLVIFESRQIRRTWYKNEWFFSVVDIVGVLTDSANPTDYLKKLRKRDDELGFYIGTNCPQVEMATKKGKKRKTLAGNSENIFRIIQSIPSPKAEPFKMWLAQVGKDRIDEIENPELAQERMKQIYKQKGYPKDWIDKRIRGIAIRQNLTDEWKERGIKVQNAFAILTAEISKAAFGVTPSEYKKLKNIPSKSKINLRDNMTDLELIFTMLGEKVTTEISQKEKPNTFTKNKKVAKRGGGVAGKARKETEKEIGRSVISKNNYLSNEKIKTGVK